MPKKISKRSVEVVALLILMIFSFVNTVALLFFLVSILFLLRQGAPGALKIIILIMLRTVINPGIAVPIESFEMVKMGILMISALYLISKHNKLDSLSRNQLKWPLVTISAFGMYNFFVAFVFSSLPVVASSKMLFYIVVFLGVLIGVAYVVEKFDVFKWLTNWIKLIMLISLFTIPLDVAYLKNGRAFQGILNHPNMFGIFAVLFIALLLAQKIKKIDIIFLVITLIMIALSDSRTSLIAAVVIVGVYILTTIINNATFLKLSLLAFSAASLLIFYERIIEFFANFMAKGGTLDDVLFSREEQIGELLFNFQQNPIFGNGFNVPLLLSRDFSFSTAYIVESGNLILSVLSFSGIIGFFIFSLYMIQILFSNKSNLLKRPFVLIAPILVSMGEMVFFSSNNIGPFCYLMIAMYMFYDKNRLQTSQ